MYKKLLLSFLALNSIIAPQIKANSGTKLNYDKLYDNMTKNIDTGKSNENNYKLIENVLKKRNKELKDLYLQGDYIVKPEYLEWLVSFSGFYTEKNLGDNSSNNARYRSEVEGYYDSSGEFIVTSESENGVAGKSYADKQKIKYITLGANIPQINTEKQPVAVNIGELMPASVTPNIIQIPKPDVNVVLTNIGGVEIPTVPVPPTGMGSSGIIINPNQSYSVTPLFPTGTGTISGGTYNTSGINDSLYSFTLDNETLQFNGNVSINGNSGVITSNFGPTSITGASITNNANMIVKSTGNGMEGFHSNSSLPGYLDFINNNILDIEYDSASDYSQRLFFYGNIDLINSGTINYTNNSPGGTKALYSMWNALPDDPNPFRVENHGIINVTGSSALPYSSTVMAHHYGHLSSTALGQHTFINDGTINLNNALGYLQDYSTGIYDATSGGIMNVNTNAVGIELTLIGNSERIFNQSTLKVGTINVNGDSNAGGAYSKAVNIALGSFPTITIEISDGTINLRSNSLGIITNTIDQETINNSAAINITGGNSYGFISYGGGYPFSLAQINNSGDISVNVSGSTLLSAGIYHQIITSFTNTGNIRVNSTGINSSGLAGILLDPEAVFTNDGTGGKKISASGAKATGVFANGNTTNTIKNTKIEASSGGIGIFSYNGSDVKLDNITGEASSGGVLFYAADTPTASKITFSTPSTANIKSNGIGFYLDGSLSLVANYYNNLNNLTLKMDDNSAIFLLDNPGTYSIGVLPTASGLGLNIDSSSGNYNDIIINRGTINIDNVSGNPVFNLDNPADALNRNQFYSSNLNLASGSSIIGTGTGQQAMAQASFSGSLSNADVILNNNGIISLSGNNSLGMFTNYGTINNNNTINTTGSNSVAIYGENGTNIQNLGNVTIGNKGVGIYAISDQDLLTSSGFGDNGVIVKNSGTITSTGGSGVTGIYADNNAGVVSPATLNLDNGVINLGASDKAVGIYANQMNITGGGTVTVGSNGVGMYAENSNIVLSNLIMNLNGDNALGYYIQGNNSSFSGTSTLNISGQNVVLFNINSTSSTIDFSGVSVGTEAPGSSYILGNLTNGKVIYNSAANLKSNGVLLNGINTNVVLGSSANITAAPGETGIAGVVLSGWYTGASPYTPGIDGQNNGTIALGDSSVGLYGSNGARLENTNIVTIGNSGLGLSSSDAGSLIKNSGVITVGSNSQGIFLKDGLTIDNTGIIQSTGVSSLGIYADNITSPIHNTSTGVIDLSGDKSIGIYTAGASTKTINNDGIIKIGNSSDVNNPGIGIYSLGTGDVINNSVTSKIETGTNSIGVYSGGTLVTQDGELKIGDSGTGIYKKGGTLNVGATTTLDLGQNSAVGFYGTDGSTINIANGAVINAGSGSFVSILESGGATLNNDAAITLNGLGTFVYSTSGGNITNNGIINMNGDDNLGFYMKNGGNLINTGNITGDTGVSNIGIYNNGGSIQNTGNIKVGDTVLVYEQNPNGTYVLNTKGQKIIDTENTQYAVGIYSENSAGTVINGTAGSPGASGNIEIGSNSIGIYAKNSANTVENYGNISAGSSTVSKDGAMGIFVEGVTNKTGIINYGDITLYGKGVMGIVGKDAGLITNYGTISVSGENAVGIYTTLATTINNQGTIIIDGANSIGIVAPKANVINEGIIEYTDMTMVTIASQRVASQNSYPALNPVEYINAGLIITNGLFDNTGMDISIKPNLSTLVKPSATDAEYDFEMKSGSIQANTLKISRPVKILADFSQGTSGDMYKLIGVFKTSNVVSTDFEIVSKSLTWEAIPGDVNNGYIDVYMKKLAYSGFTDGLWFEDFGASLDKTYANSTGDAGKIYDKIDLLEDESDFRHAMASLAGNVYANMNQRENDIATVLENSLGTLKSTDGNTKENVKINIIGGAGKTKEDTDGVVEYDYKTTGVLALREVERTDKQTFGYSLGYLHTNFDYKDGNDSEEGVDTIQLGVHNKYVSNGWKLVNDLTGRASIHDVDRNIDWPSPTGRSEMNGTYESYSVTSDNIFGKELELGKNTSITPYGALRAMYVMRPTFNESGLEALEVEGNDAWSVKPRVGVELKGTLPLGKRNEWQLKGALDFSYEYELADLNERESARLTAMDSDYHRLAKPEEENGEFRTRASLGMEIKDRYGIFLTGDYSLGSHSQDEYKAGVDLKVAF